MGRDSQWLQEVYSTRGARPGCPCNLEVARAWKNDTALQDMVRDEHAKRARGGRAKGSDPKRTGHGKLHKWMRVS